MEIRRKMRNAFAIVFEKLEGKLKIHGRFRTSERLTLRLKGRPHEAILPRSFVRVRPSQPRTRTKVRVRVRVRRPPTMLDFLYVAHIYDVQMYELAVFR